MATNPGSIPTTPIVEHPPMLTCQSPQMHLQHGDYAPQQVTCPSHPTHAPLSSFLQFFIKQSLTRYRHCGLSEPSMTRSYQSSSCRVFLVMQGCSLTFMFGLRLSKLNLSDYVFGFPTVLVECPICLCKFVISTVSESNSPSVPTPAPAKQRLNGHPIPPAPINATLAVLILNWPSYAIYFSNICLEYLSSKSPNNGDLRLVQSGPAMNY